MEEESKKVKQEKPDKSLLACPIDGYADDLNLWEPMFNLRVKQSRKEAKLTYLQPLQLNSHFSFYIKDRNVKIKKYIHPSQVHQAQAQAQPQAPLK